MDWYQAGTLSVAFLSLLFSIINYRNNYRISRETKTLSYRKTVADQYRFYVDLLHDTFLKNGKSIYELSSLCADFNFNLGHIFDLHDARPKTSSYKRPLRHHFQDLHEGITEALESALLTGLTENILIRVNRIKFIDIEYDLESELPEKIGIFKKFSLFFSERRVGNPEWKYIRKGPGKENFLAVAAVSKPDELYLEAKKAFKEVSTFYSNKKNDLIESYEKLEAGWKKNRVEEFKLVEHPELFDKYTVVMNAVAFIAKVPLNDNEWDEIDQQYRQTISMLIYFAVLSSITSFYSRKFYDLLDD